MELRHGEGRQAAGDTAEARADGLYGYVQKCDGSRCAEGDEDRAGNALGVFQAENHYRDRGKGEDGRGPGDRAPGLRERLHAVEDVALHMIHAEPEEVAELR